MSDSTVGGLPQAEKPISEITETTTLGNNDLLLVEQGGNARKIKGQSLKQYFNANVVSAEANAIEPTQDPAATYNPNTNNLLLNLPSADYIVSITKTGTSGLVDTYTVTTALGYTVTFEVTNGVGSPASEIPLADVAGGSVGTSEKYAREDHQHPLIYPDADNVQALALDGHSVEINFVQDLNNLVSGVGAFQPSTLHSPFSDTWGFVISAGDASYTRMQVAYPFSAAYPPKRRDLSGGVWSAWTDVTALQDSGWIEVTFTADFKNYGATNHCQYRKVGNVVTVCGAATPVNDIAGSNTQYTMFTLPTGYRPKVVLSTIQQGSGNARWQMQIGSGNGAVTFSRYADDTGYITANGGSPGAWLVFSATFLTA